MIRPEVVGCPTEDDLRRENVWQSVLKDKSFKQLTVQDFIYANEIYNEGLLNET